MRWLLAMMLVFGAVPLLGCEENVDPATPDGAMHVLRDALIANDLAALLDRSSARTRQQLAELKTLLDEQKVAIDERYPDEHKVEARQAFPKGTLEAQDTVALFGALVKPQIDKLDRDERLAYGMSTLGKPNVDGERATVTTQSGESVEFVLEDGAWKTTVFERPIEQNLNRIKLNRQTLEENLKVFEEMKRRAAAKKAKEEAAAKP